MATHGSVYNDMLGQAKKHLTEAEKVSSNGDLWNAHINLTRARDEIEDAIALIEKVSKVAFERVFQEKAS